VLAVLAQDMEADSGRMEVIGVARIVASLVPGYSTYAQCGAARGGRILHLNKTASWHKLAVVLPHHKLWGNYGLANNTLELE